MGAQNGHVERLSGRRRRAFGGCSVSTEAQDQGQSPELCDWFKPRPYKHFDQPVGASFAAKVFDPAFVAAHPFSPLIHYVKSEKRYKKCEKSGRRVLSLKERPIKYASHRDACIFSYYAHRLGLMLNDYYTANGLTDSVIAYRALGRSNYDFAAAAHAFACQNLPATILAFDVTGFFDNLDHRLLKSRLKRLLGVAEVPSDWFKVLRAVTRYHYVDLEELKAQFAPRFEGRDLIATVSELKAAGIRFQPNATPTKGIPQGTPISAAASNLYMIDFDLAAKTFCDRIGALFMRYSDDILVICKPDDAKAVEAEIMRLIADERLEIQPHKTDVTTFDATSSAKMAQYLGFMLGVHGCAIRPSSLSRQWRKMRRAFKRIRRVAEAEIAAGRADRAYTKRLRKRFTALGFRNFSAYARRSAKAFGGSRTIKRQTLRFERAVEHELRSLQDLRTKTAP